MEGIELPATLALLFASDLTGARQRQGKRRPDIHLAGDLAADVADQPAEPGAQDAQLATVAVELLGVGVASRHHRRAFGDTDVGLPQLHPVLLREAVEPLAACDSLSSVGKRMFLGCTVVSTVTRLRSLLCSAPLACAAGSRPIAAPACRRAASANGSGQSVHAGNSCWKNLIRDVKCCDLSCLEHDPERWRFFRKDHAQTER
jgi:hypothetical protein